MLQSADQDTWMLRVNRRGLLRLSYRDGERVMHIKLRARDAGWVVGPDAGGPFRRLAGRFFSDRVALETACIACWPPRGGPQSGPLHGHLRGP